MSKAFAISIIQTLRQQGFQAYLVGGCVRDLLLKREPADYDIATNATPAQVMEIFPDTYAVGAQFGVVLVPLPEEQSGSDENILQKAHAVEVATFRSDLGYSDGRRPDEVRFSQDAREDVATPRLYHQRHAARSLCRRNGRRGARFRGRAGGPESRHHPHHRRSRSSVLRKTNCACCGRCALRRASNMRSKRRRWPRFERLAREIQVVSRERVRDELTKMLTEGHARRAFLLLDESGLLKEVLPEISAMKGVEQPPSFIRKAMCLCTRCCCWRICRILVLPTLAWGALLHDVGKPATFRVAPDRIRFDGHVDVGVKIAEEICRRLRFSNDDTEQVLALVGNHMRFGHVTRMKESTLKKFLRMPGFDEHLALHRADSLASHGNLSTYRLIQKKLAEIPPAEIRPAALVTGDDLIAAGYEPGPRFREILEAVEDAQLEGRLLSRDQALEFVEREFPL